MAAGSIRLPRLMLGLLIAAGLQVTAASAAGAATTTINVQDDAHVAAGQPAKNFGQASVLETDKSPDAHALLRFTIPSGLGTITKATLRLHVTNGSPDGAAVYGTGTAAWTENGVTWSNKPAIGAKLADVAAVSPGQIVSYVVTSGVTNKAGTITFTLTAPVADGTDFSSGEASANKPQLILETGTTTTPTPPNPTPPPAGGKSLLGMAAYVASWDQRVKEVGPGLQARRIFYTSFTDSLTLSETTCKAGMTPIISFKTGKYSWAQVGAGNADADLKALAKKLAALPCPVYVVVHHEPNKDGSASDYSKMQIRALPILGGSLTDSKVKAGLIINGFFFNSNAQGLSDAELDTWAGPNVRAVSDFVGADTYQMSLPEEAVAPKIVNMGNWARRVNAKTPNTPVRGLGLGEFNAQTAQGVTDSLKALKADPLFRFGCYWNNDELVLTGASLTAFRTGLANW